MLLAGDRNGDMYNLLHNFFNNLLNGHWDLNCSNDLMRDLHSLDHRDRNIIRDFNSAFNNADNFVGNLAVNNALHRICYLNRSRYWDMDRCRDWDGAVDNTLNNLFDRVGYVTSDNLLHRVGNLNRDFLVLRYWDLHNLFHNLLHWVWDRLVDNSLNWHRHSTFDDDLMRHGNLHNLWNCNLTMAMNNLLNDLLHRVRNITV